MHGPKKKVAILKFCSTFLNTNFESYRDDEMSVLNVAGEIYFRIQIRLSDFPPGTFSDLRELNRTLRALQPVRYGFSHNKVYRDFYIVNHLSLTNVHAVFFFPESCFLALMFIENSLEAIDLDVVLGFGNNFCLPLLYLLLKKEDYATSLEFSDLKKILGLQKKYQDKNGKWNFKKRVLENILLELEMSSGCPYSLSYANERNTDIFELKLFNKAPSKHKN